jgi:competence protein ComGD
MSKGFTLFELAIVLAIMAIISSIAIAGFGSAGNSRRSIEEASRILQEHIRYAQRVAVTEGVRVQFEANEGTSSYSITIAGATESLLKWEFPGGVYFEQVRDVFFRPRGTPSASFTIVLKNSNYRQRITLQLSGGRVRIQDAEPIN